MCWKLNLKQFLPAISEILERTAGPRAGICMEQFLQIKKPNNQILHVFESLYLVSSNTNIMKNQNIPVRASDLQDMTDPITNAIDDPITIMS